MKIIEVTADPGNTDTVAGIAEQHGAQDFRLAYKNEVDDRQAMRMLVADEQAQPILDALQSALGGQPSARIIVIPVEAVLPRPQKPAVKP